VNEYEEKRQQFLSQLKTFRPPSTVLEQQESTEESILTMERKRRSHSGSIQKMKYHANDVDDEDIETSSRRNMMTRADFRDPQFYLSFTSKNHFSEKGLEIDKESENIEELILDVIPDDDKGIFKTRKSTVWDKRKNNFIQVPSGTIDKKGKVITESGKRASAKDRGKLYQTWVKKSKTEIGKIGEKESDTSLSNYRTDSENLKFKHHKSNPQHTQNSQIKDELKNPDQIKKEKNQLYKKQMKSNPSKRKFSSSSSKKSSASSTSHRPTKKRRLMKTGMAPRRSKVLENSKKRRKRKR